MPVLTKKASSVQNAQNGITIEQYFKKFKAATGFHVRYETNCTSLNDVQYIFLGEFHGSEEMRNANTLLAASMIHLNQSLSTIYAEGNAETVDDMIDTRFIPKRIRYESWDDQSTLDIHTSDSLMTQNDHFIRMKKIGILVQNLLRLIKRDNQLPGYKAKSKTCTFAKLAAEINALIAEEAPNRKIFLSFLKKTRNGDLKRVSKAKLVEIGPQEVDNPRALMKRLSNLYVLVESQYTTLVNATMKPRQKVLAQTIEKTQPSVFLGGQDHFTCEDCGEIDHTLAKQLKSQKANYLFVYDAKKPSGHVVEPEESFIHKAPDFNHLPPNTSQNYLLALLSKKIATCRNLIAKHY